MSFYQNGNMRIKLNKKENIIEKILRIDPLSLTYYLDKEPYTIENLKVKKIKAHFDDGKWIPKKIKIYHVDGRCLTTLTKVYL